MRRIVVGPALAVAGGILFAGGAAAADVAECVRIESDLDRLACYDKASGKTPTETNLNPTGKWGVRVEKSDFKDTTDVYMSVASDDPINCGRISGPRYAQLYLRCQENSTAIYISTQCHLTSSRYNDYGSVDVRIDDARSRKIPMDSSTSNDSLGLWSGGRAIPFIKTMLGGDIMLVRFTPYGESPVTARFQISGLDEAIKPLRESCGW